MCSIFTQLNYSYSLPDVDKILPKFVWYIFTFSCYYFNLNTLQNQEPNYTQYPNVPYPYPYAQPAPVIPNPNRPYVAPNPSTYPPPLPAPGLPPDQQYIYAQNSVDADTVRDAFKKIKDERREAIEKMRKKQAEKERKEEEEIEKEAKKIEEKNVDVKKEDEKKVIKK